MIIKDVKVIYYSFKMNMFYKEYKSIGRKLLTTSELPLGALARYERDIAVTNYTIPKKQTQQKVTLNEG